MFEDNVHCCNASLYTIAALKPRNDNEIMVYSYRNIDRLPTTEDAIGGEIEKNYLPSRTTASPPPTPISMIPGWTWVASLARRRPWVLTNEWCGSSDMWGRV